MGEAEVVASALQTRDRAPLIGTNSVGKGYRQQMLSFPDGSALHLSVSEYLDEKNESFHGKGIEPTERVRQDRKEKSNDPGVLVGQFKNASVVFHACSTSSMTFVTGRRWNQTACHHERSDTATALM